MWPVSTDSKERRFGEDVSQLEKALCFVGILKFLLKRGVGWWLPCAAETCSYFRFPVVKTCVLTAFIHIVCVLYRHTFRIVTLLHLRFVQGVIQTHLQDSHLATPGFLTGYYAETTGWHTNLPHLRYRQWCWVSVLPLCYAVLTGKWLPTSRSVVEASYSAPNILWRWETVHIMCINWWRAVTGRVSQR